MFIRSRKAQNTLEYILVLTAIVGLMLWAAVSVVKPKVDTAFQDVANSIEHTGNQLAPSGPD